jgi:mannose-6-phosphate isomerase-like protein (cupin superfamily)
MATPSIVQADFRFQKCNIFDAELDLVRAHNGRGRIRFKRLLTGEQIEGACNFMDFSVIPPGSTIAEHRHALDEEEYYLILEGSGSMSRDGETFQVQPGDLIRNRPGGTHSLVNDSEHAIALFVFELRVAQ